MARIRTIKPEFFAHEGLASKSAHARLLAIGLLTLADCEGRLRWVPMQVHAQVFPWEAPGEAFENIEVLLGELIDIGYVLHYEADGKRYVEIVNFRKHQRLSGKELNYTSRCPPPPDTSEKHSVLPDENGEAPGKHPGASLGSSGNPLGTGEHRNRGTGEQGNREREETASPVSHVPDSLVQFIEEWNPVARRHGIPETSMPPPKRVVSAWKAAMRDADKREALRSVQAIDDAISASDFVQGNGNFNLAGLLASNRTGESKLLKLLNGDYKNAKNGRGKFTVGPGQRYEPGSATQTTF